MQFLEILLKIKSIAQLFEFLKKVFSGKRKKLAKKIHVVSGNLGLLAVLLLCSYGFVKFYNWVNISKEIMKLEDDLVNACGKGSFVSWIAVKDAHDSKMLSFYHVRGCPQELDYKTVCDLDFQGRQFCHKSCATDVMNLNQELYLLPHAISQSSFDFLKGIFFEKFYVAENKFYQSQTGDQVIIPPPLIAIFNQTKDKPVDFRIAVSRNIFGRITGIFTFAFVEGAERTCAPELPSQTLKSFADLTKDLL